MSIFGAPDIEKMKAAKNTNGLYFALKNRDPQVRIAAMQALGELAQPGTEVMLVNVVQTDKDTSIRIAALRALGMYQKSSEAAEALITTAKYNPIPDLRREALVAIRNIDCGNVLDDLVDLCLNKDKQAGAAAVLALLAAGEAGETAFLERILIPPDHTLSPRYVRDTNVRAALDGPEGDRLLGSQSALTPVVIGKIIEDLIDKLYNDSVESSLGTYLLPHVTHPLSIRVLFDHIKTDCSQIRDPGAAKWTVKAKRTLISLLEKLLEEHLAAVDDDILQQISAYTLVAPVFGYEEKEEYALYPYLGTQIIPTPTLTQLAQEELKRRSAT